MKIVGVNTQNVEVVRRKTIEVLERENQQILTVELTREDLRAMHYHPGLRSGICWNLLKRIVEEGEESIRSETKIVGFPNSDTDKNIYISTPEGYELQKEN